MTDEINPEDQALNELFDGSGQPEINTEPEGEIIKEEPIAEGVAEEPATEPPAEEEQKLVPIAALLDERRKAQKYKEENENLRGLLPKKEEAPDPYEDIDAYNAYMRQQWERESSEKQRAANSERIDRSRSQMLEKHDDFLEMENIFTIMQASDPSLFGKMLESGNEVEFAYSAAKAYKEAILGGKPAPIVQEPSEAQKRKAAALGMPNLAKATAQAANTAQLETEKTIDDIFADQKY